MSIWTQGFKGKYGSLSFFYYSTTQNGLLISITVLHEMNIFTFEVLLCLPGKLPLSYNISLSLPIH